MTADQLLQEAEKLLDECEEADELDQPLIFQGNAVQADVARPVIEYMTELIREFVVAQNNPKKRT